MKLFVLLLAFLLSTALADSFRESLIDDDDIDRPVYRLKPTHTPCTTHTFVTAIPIPTSEPSLAPIVDPLVTPEPSTAPMDPFVTPEPSTAPMDPFVTPEPSAAAKDPFITPDTAKPAVSPTAQGKPSRKPEFGLTTPEPSAAVVDPMVSPQDTIAPCGQKATSTLPESIVKTPKPSATAHEKADHLPHSRSKKCYLRNVNFSTGTASRCCMQRFPCHSTECGFAQECKSRDVSICRKHVCRKVFIKLSYTKEVDDDCSEQLLNHF